jgi:hypothetical protein
MKTRTKFRALFAFLVVLVTSGIDLGPTPMWVQDAHAVVGRPLTPVSYAGVARRTSRRTTRRGEAAEAAYW